jgi:hypothetical protein
MVQKMDIRGFGAATGAAGFSGTTAARAEARKREEVIARENFMLMICKMKRS